MRGDRPPEGPLEALRGLGASEAQLAEARALLGEGEAHCPVWSCNWPALQLFMDLDTQWHLLPNGRRQALRRGAIHHTLILTNVKRKRWPDLYDRLRTLEEAALSVMG